MKKISAILLAISFLAVAGVCSARTIENIQERNGLVYAPNEDAPFTGTYKINPKYAHKQEWNYKNGKKNGKHIEWHYNGQKETEENYKDGKEIGLSVTWHDNGQKESEENYRDGVKHGTATYWYDSGQIKREDIYEDGVRIK